MQRKLTKAEAGRLGGLKNAANHLTVCKECGQPIMSEHFRKIGRRGAAVTNQDRERQREYGRMGGRGNKRQLQEKGFI